MSLGALVTPWSRNVPTLVTIWAIGGIGSGALETGLNVVCLNIWGKESPPYFQGLHFLFGLGAFIAPLIAEPFLHKQFTVTNFTSSNNDSQTVNENLTHISFNDGALPPVTYSYTIIGAVSVLSTIYLLVLAMLFPKEEKRSKEKPNESNNPAKENILYTISVAFLAQILLSSYCGIEIGYGQMLVTFAVKGDLKLSKSTASFMTALYWGTFTSFRGFAVFLSSKFSAFTVLFVDLVVVLTSTVLLLVYGSTYVEVLWAGTFLLAVGLASFYPSVIVWVESYIHINNKIAALFVVAGTFGEMVVPLTVSRYIETSPHMLMDISMGCAIGGTITLFALWLLLNRKTNKRNGAQAI